MKNISKSKKLSNIVEYFEKNLNNIIHERQQVILHCVVYHDVTLLDRKSEYNYQAAIIFLTIQKHCMFAQLHKE